MSILASCCYDSFVDSAQADPYSTVVLFEEQTYPDAVKSMMGFAKVMNVEEDVLGNASAAVTAVFESDKIKDAKA